MHERDPAEHFLLDDVGSSRKEIPKSLRYPLIESHHMPPRFERAQLEFRRRMLLNIHTIAAVKRPPIVAWTGAKIAVANRADKPNGISIKA